MMMPHKKINKDYRKLISLPFNLNFSPPKSKLGIIYTLYSDRLNILEVGFAKNNIILEAKLLNNEFLLLDKQKGNEKQLNLLIKTLNALGIKYSNKFNFTYSKTLMRHLSTLGWPIGKSLYKKRIIRNELSFV